MLYVAMPLICYVLSCDVILVLWSGILRCYMVCYVVIVAMQCSRVLICSVTLCHDMICAAKVCSFKFGYGMLCCVLSFLLCHDIVWYVL